MDPPSFLFGDVLRQTLALMPLVQFQEHYSEETQKKTKHALTFAERYLVKYGQKFEQIEGTTFENEEDQYLFCAFYFHGEVGLRSHLFAPSPLCLYRAIDIEDIELCRYFLERQSDNKLAKYRYIQYLLSKKKYKVLKTLLERNSVNLSRSFQEWRLPQEAAKALFERYEFDLLAFANLPLEDLPPAISENFYPYFLHGFVISGDPQKKERVKEEFLGKGRKIFKMSEYYEISAALRILIELNDLQFFVKICQKYQRKVLGDRLRLFSFLVSSGAGEILQWLESTYPELYLGIKPFNEEEGDFFERPIFDHRFDSKRQLCVLERILKNYPEFAHHPTASYVWLRNSDIRFFETDFLIASLPVLDLALEFCSEGFLREFCRRINKEHEENPQKDFFAEISFNYPSAKRYQALGLDPKIIMIDDLQDLRYSQFEDLAQGSFMIWPNSLSLFFPTPFLLQKATTRLTSQFGGNLNLSEMDFAAQHCLKLFPINVTAFGKAFENNNLEYMALAGPHLEGQKFSAEDENVHDFSIYIIENGQGRLMEER